MQNQQRQRCYSLVLVRLLRYGGEGAMPFGGFETWSYRVRQALTRECVSPAAAHSRADC